MIQWLILARNERICLFKSFLLSSSMPARLYRLALNQYKAGSRPTADEPEAETSALVISYGRWPSYLVLQRDF